MNRLRRATLGREARSWDGYQQQLEWFAYHAQQYLMPHGTWGPADRERIEGTWRGLAAGAYAGNGVVFAVVAVRMLLFAEARFLWQRVIDGRPSDLFRTGALDILDEPWANGTTGEMLARMEQDATLAGNWFGLFRGGQVVRLEPDRVQIVTGGRWPGDVDARVVGYIHTPGTPGTPEFLPVEEVAHYSPIPDPTATYRGMSWLTPVLRDIEGDTAASRHKLKFFEHGGTPNVIFTYPAEVKQEQLAEVARTVAAGQEGLHNAYRWLHVGGGADPHVVGASMEQLDFRATQGAGETRIAAAAGVPPVLVGLSEGLDAATYSNYAQARRRFADGTMRPLWRIAAASLARPLGPAPPSARLWYDDRDIPFLAEDQKDAAEIMRVKATTAETLIHAGYDPASVAAAVDAGDMTDLTHTGRIPTTLYPGGEDPEDGEL